mgnify:CR=1 FL=1
MGYAEFLGFQAAFSSFNNTLVSVIPLVASFFTVQPHIENFRPILEAEPDITEDKIDADVLSGSLEVRHLGFAYEEGKDVLKDISFQVRVTPAIEHLEHYKYFLSCSSTRVISNTGNITLCFFV